MKGNSFISNHFKLIGILSLVVSVHFLIALRFFGIWFLIDDFVPISTVLIYSPMEILFSRDAYALFNRWFFTPLLPISFKLDWYLFKLNPWGYHLHNYFLILANALVIYKITRLYLPPRYCLLAAIFFLFSVPAFINIANSSLRHYSWGCLFIFLGFYLYKRFEEKGSKKLLLFSIICYFIATLFKSVFILFPLAILALSQLDLHKRFKVFVLYTVIFLLYFLWRIHILGGLGGYTFIPTPDLLHAISTLFLNIPYIIGKTIWRIPFFTYFIFLGLIIIKPRLGIILFFLTLLSATPFIFTKPSETYSFTGKFILISAMVAIAMAFLVYYLAIKIKESFRPYFCYLICSLILILQVTNLPGAFREAYASSQFIKNTCHKLLEQDVKVLYDPYAWVYNYFYLVRSLQGEKLSLIGIGTLDRNDLYLDLYLYQRYINSLSDSEFIFIAAKGKIFRYIELKKEVEALQEKETLSRPVIALKNKANLLSGRIMDKRVNGHFKAYLFSPLTERNILFWSIPIRRKAFSCPIRKGEIILFLFVSSDGRFSPPLIFKN